MTGSTPSSHFGRHLFGVTAFAFGLITLVGHDYNDWHPPRYVLYAVATTVFFAIAGTNWILADLLAESRLSAHSPQ
ncbi:MAG TPA: hypothetical protein VMI32_09005 [Candidatus Solibacter sp.]|nr:hypothetical protein [Candidatus Solibacter sp.]